ncbi:hypothetical protein SAMN04487895_12232 [Paenibacillus sophorae]|uniref:Uncharacterized protein n=1 Tax=Paenibacillus sophorae TaxID=1333845 RepID=A0A1H8VB10_9BACL|nr:hypothetical protein [Paenibacillus sophorae]QWU13233.1 hypothetical protein KP014_14525 [Paenibacillus sophorae]SEP12028.1 hypothetical protein SAMN04487895_12232 [Paenibacillus sophorae]
MQDYEYLCIKIDSLFTHKTNKPVAATFNGYRLIQVNKDAVLLEIKVLDIHAADAAPSDGEIKLFQD